MAEWTTQPMYYAAYGRAAAPRSGAHHASIAPYGPFATADGTVFLAVQNEREWERFCANVLDRPELLTDARFCTNTGRVEHLAALHEVVAQRAASLSSMDLLGLLDEARIANARLRTMTEIAEHPQLRTRKRWRTVGTPGCEIDALRPPLTSRRITAAMGDVPRLGAHTTAVRQEFSPPRATGSSHPTAQWREHGHLASRFSSPAQQSSR